MEIIATPNFRVDREAQADAFAAQCEAGPCKLLDTQKFGKHYEGERHKEVSCSKEIFAMAGEDLFLAVACGEGGWEF